MCGIMGYIGTRPAKDIIYTGLKRMEYRGYDSAGVAVLDSKFHTIKAVGDTSNLDISSLPAYAKSGIGHTRWATHGVPSVENAHPHTYGAITIVHNGIIENYQQLAESIETSKLQSQTDSEVLAAVINEHYQKNKDLLRATQAALAQVKGTFGLAIMASNKPSEIVVARRGSPIVIGVGNKQNFVASDPAAIIDHTHKVVYLEDDQIARVTATNIDVYDLKLNHQTGDVTELETVHNEDIAHSYSSFLEKEIFEQPDSLRNLMRGRVQEDGSIVLGGPNLSQTEIEQLKHIVILACGTAYYAGLYAKYALEEMLHIAVSVEHASEFRYRYGAYEPANSLAIFVSQSGETADLIASLKEAKRRNIMTMGIVNVVGSTIARSVDHGGIYLHAGQETSVASTKAYSAMVGALLMLGGYIAYKRGLNPVQTRSLAHQLLALPQEVQHTLELKPIVDKLAAELADFHDWFFLGRHTLYPVALEGALKLTEVSYVHAQGLPIGEMKHGPIALVNPKHVSVLLLPEDELLYEKGLSTLEELKSRQGVVVTISTRSKPKRSDHHVQLAHVGDQVDGLVFNVVLQLLALAIASKKGVNIDKPRNLAKSVTVE